MLTAAPGPGSRRLEEPAARRRSPAQGRSWVSILPSRGDVARSWALTAGVIALSLALWAVVVLALAGLVRWMA